MLIMCKCDVNNVHLTIYKCIEILQKLLKVASSHLLL